MASSSVAKLDGNVEIINKENIMRGAELVIDFDKEISRIISTQEANALAVHLPPDNGKKYHVDR